jgi:MarR family transcriptional regulator for hemolysin
MNEFLSLFTRASKLMRGAVDEAMSHHGVRVGQNLVLEVLWETDGLTPGELADRLHVATPTMVKSANRMAAAGLIARRRDPADARLARIYLTERARLVRGAIEQERDELERRATATLTSAERTHLLSALTKIIAQFAGAGPTDAPSHDADAAGHPSAADGPRDTP